MSTTTPLLRGLDPRFLVAGLALLAGCGADAPSSGIHSEPSRDAGTHASDAHAAVTDAQTATPDAATTPVLDSGAAPDAAMPATDAGTPTSGTPGPLSGLPWVSGAGTEDPIAFGTWRGRPLDVTATWMDAPDWASVEAGWTLPQYDSFPGVLAVGLGSFPSHGADLASCARGDYDGDMRTIANLLVAHHQDHAFLRLGYEFNGDWMPWSVHGSVADYVGCFRHEVTALRAVAPGLQIDWNPSGGMTVNDASMYYPGDAYVDIVGIDYYDMWPATHSDAEWTTNCNAGTAAHPVGLCRWIEFARAHHKRWSLPEWGIDPASASAGGGGFDNPLFIQKMYDTMQANRDDLAYECYFNLQGAGFQIDPATWNPLASARYLSLFGH